MTTQSNVVSLSGEECDPRVSSDDVVSLLEEMLERARAGEIVGIAFAAMNFDKSASACHTGISDDVALIGALCKLINELSR